VPGGILADEKCRAAPISLRVRIDTHCTVLSCCCPARCKLAAAA
jgi:hypothetical protein